MQSTRALIDESAPRYIGADLTDRFSAGRKPVDVCGLLDGNEEHRFEAVFWQWIWTRDGSNAIDVGAVAAEIRAARVSMIDGPVGLATPTGTMRACERVAGAAGKTPYVIPVATRGRPFAGYIRTSVEFASQLWAQPGLTVDPEPRIGSGAVFECYPGAAWTRVSNLPLARKRSQLGKEQRRHLLHGLGVSIAIASPSDDQLDACLAALLAAALDGRASFPVDAIGSQLVRDPAGALREGRMWMPKLDLAARQRLIADMPRTPVRQTSRVPLDSAVQSAAQMLLADLATRLVNGNPTVITYSAAYEKVFGRPWRSQAHAEDLSKLASCVGPTVVEGLGQVWLDAFVVNGKTCLPGGDAGEGHWDGVGYDVDDWLRAFGGAEVLRRERHD